MQSLYKFFSKIQNVVTTTCPLHDRPPTDQLHDLLQVILLLQNLFEGLHQTSVYGVEIRLKKRGQNPHVFRKGDGPIDRWEVLALGEFF